jgi:hypothetical protein
MAMRAKSSMSIILSPPYSKSSASVKLGHSLGHDNIASPPTVQGANEKHPAFAGIVPY